jgi:hypothetical protein
MRRFFCGFILLIVTGLKGQVTDSPVAKYTFNSGNANDETGNNHAKAIGVSLTSDRFGNPRSAYFLHGNNSSYLNLGTSKTLKPSTITISLWVKLDHFIYKGSGVAHNPIIITKSNASDDFFEAYYMGINTDTRKINMNSANGELQGVGITSVDTIILQKWHHLVLAFDDKYMWSYIDGLMQNDNKPIAKNFRSVFLETDSVMIGNMANRKNNRYLIGSVDDILIYNRILSPDEVYALYTAPDPNKNHLYWLWAGRVLAAIVVVMLIILLIIRRYKIALRKEKEKNWTQMRLIELETKAIRTQMNPHFMFNSLNTLQSFILDGNVKGAHLYLAKFSKLLRKVLESSTSDAIQLSEEIDILRSYIEIERLRFNHSFNYSLTSTIPDPEKCYIPFLLVQPFVENAIWHGLLPLNGERFLSIDFSSPDERVIFCTIEDNGVGRDHSSRQKDPSKKKSLALEFIGQRLQLLEKSTGIKCAFEIFDKKNDEGESTGTRVEISIPKRNYE